MSIKVGQKGFRTMGMCMAACLVGALLYSGIDHEAMPGEQESNAAKEQIETGDASNGFAPDPNSGTAKAENANADDTAVRRTAKLKNAAFRTEWYGVVKDVVRSNPSDEEIQDIIEYIRRYDSPNDEEERILAQKIESVMQLAYVGDERVLKHMKEIYPENRIDEFMKDWDRQDTSSGVPLSLKKTSIRTNAYYVLALIDSPEAKDILLQEYNKYRARFEAKSIGEETEVYFRLQEARGLMDACEELGRDAVLRRIYSSDSEEFLMELSLKY